ncbi:hypothetical protein [Azospirillum sp. SYSU D00513]|uniref:hypothetical protein n=1 Tax=Azospirillum sp. SYSU D00513 TaxID=2812561 RepID=UPI001A973D45|nr:hypothetical protein [Azospirillum sp. SYSU D00513]
MRQSTGSAPGRTVADLFGVTTMLALLRRAESGNTDGEELAGADWTLEERLRSALARAPAWMRGRKRARTGPASARPPRAACRASRWALCKGRSEDTDGEIFDEPTNHLDLDAVQAIEAGLRAYDGALLVVSHDEAFVEAIGITRGFELGEKRWAPGDRERWPPPSLKASTAVRAHRAKGEGGRALSAVACMTLVTLRVRPAAHIRPFQGSPARWEGGEWCVVTEPARGGSTPPALLGGEANDVKGNDHGGKGCALGQGPGKAHRKLPRGR